MKKSKFSLKDNHGMTLIEVLTAITLLTMFLGCILPLLVSTTRNIVTVGERIKESYASNSIMQKLLGNIGSNVGYTANVDNIPLNFNIGAKVLKTQKLNSITGNTLFSGSKGPGSGYSTFVADSVTTSMYCYPSHIADDFIEKDISIIATGFKFEDTAKTVVYWTNEAGVLQEVPKTYTDSAGNQRKSYTIEIDRFDAKIANFTIKADNKYINYEHSPIVIQYGYSTPILANKSLTELMAPDSEGFSKRVIVEVDAPSMIMVGEDAKKNVYYVTDGIIDDTGDLKIVRKTMGGQNSKSIPLASAMNDVQWIPAGEGDDPQTGKPNEFGYYAMCGDNAQIRRFLRSPVSGNYYWGGDNTIDYTYHATTNALTPVETFRKRDFNTPEGTTVDAKYAISIDPGGSGRENHQNAYRLDGRWFDGHGGLVGLSTYTAFSANATDLPGFATHQVYLDNDKVSSVPGPATIGFWTAGNLKFGYENFYCDDTTQNSGRRWENTKIVQASKAIDYKTFSGLPKEESPITLTSVGGINMGKEGFITDGANYPKSNYTLYCGYIPGVMDLWSNYENFQDFQGSEKTQYSRWRATLGVAFTPTTREPTADFYKLEDNKKYFNYGNLSETSYSLSGICGKRNLEGNGRTFLKDVNEEFVERTGKNVPTSPIQLMAFQNELNEQDETDITFAYLSQPYAFGAPSKKRLRDSGIDISSDRAEAINVYQWNFDLGTTIIDIDSMTYENGDGEPIPISIAVGNTLAGVENSADAGVSSATAYNNGVVFIRAKPKAVSGGIHAGHENDKEGAYMAGRCFELSGASNIFHQMFYTDMYYDIEQYTSANVGNGKNSKEKACSAWGWRDKLHPIFMSVYGNKYNPMQWGKDKWGKDKIIATLDTYSYIMGHILQNKRLTSVRWGTTYNSSPEAMWGASDGTLMSWHTNMDDKDKDEFKEIKPYASDSQYSWRDNLPSYDYQSIIAEFQAYHAFDKVKGEKDLLHQWQDFAIGTAQKDKLVMRSEHINCMANPKSIMANGETLEALGKSTVDYTHKNIKMYPWQKNAFWDAATATAKAWDETGWGYVTDKIGFVSPLDSVEDIEFGNDIWVAVGTQGQAYPSYCRTGEFGADNKKAVVGTGNGSWVNVKTWCRQFPESVFMHGPIGGDGKTADDVMTWQAVKISSNENYNIQQINFVGGIWVATGYYDANNNNKYDEATPSAEAEKGVVFFAADPAKACGEENGWKIASPKSSTIGGKSITYTESYAGVEKWDSEGNPEKYYRAPVGGVNSAACRDD